MHEKRFTRAEIADLNRMYPETRRDYNGEGNLVREWETPQELVRFWESKGQPMPFGEDRTPAKKIASDLINGDVKLVAQAEELLAKLETQAESIGPVWGNDVYGAYVSIPRYLANTPDCFNRIRDVVSDRSPLRIVVGVSNSGGVSQEKNMRRGLAIMALAMKLQAVRPVEILLFEEGALTLQSDLIYTDYLYLTRIEFPISLAHATVALCQQGAATMLMYGIAQWEAHMVRWPMNYRTTGYMNWRAYALELKENDLFIDSNYYGDGILENPVEWINKHLSLYDGTNELAEGNQDGRLVNLLERGM